MKYTDEQILSVDYFSPDEETKNHKTRIVTTRKEQTCCGLLSGETHQIPQKTRAILETAIHADDGWVRCYLCLTCATNWLDEIGIFN